MSYPARTLCYVLNDMRKIDKVKNYSDLIGLIEELEMLTLRMIDALHASKN